MWRLVACICYAGVAPNVFADFSDDLLSLSLDELTNIEVTTVSRKAEPLHYATAAVFVITAEDIRRTGVRSIPEALRMAPGISVAQLDASRWAVTARGFNGQFANKLLVMIDGRTVYSPFFSGVFWDTQDVVLADIERIEVIRGPGGALWGPNAVNGIINVITRHSQDTLGNYILGGAGNEAHGFATLRYGGRLNPATTYRVFAKGFTNDGTIITDADRQGADGWRQARAGFRLDWEGSGRDSLTILADAYHSSSGNSVTEITATAPFLRRRDVDSRLRGFFVQNEWRHRFAPKTILTLRTNVEALERKSAFFELAQQTVNLDMQQTLPLGHRIDLMLGLGLRRHWLAMPVRSLTLGGKPPPIINLGSAFVQGNVHLIPDLLGMTVGTKWSNDSLSASEWQPTVRLRLTPTTRHTLWAAFSRAVHTPSVLESAGRIRVPAALDHTPAVITEFVGNDGVISERLLAYEIGYRWRLPPYFNVDFAGFFHDYAHLLNHRASRLTAIQAALAPRSLFSMNVRSVTLPMLNLAARNWP